MNVTNVLHRDKGAWKIVHHHADRTPGVDVAMEKQAEQFEAAGKRRS
jgi:hypothetical protein